MLSRAKLFPEAVLCPFPPPPHSSFAQSTVQRVKWSRHPIYQTDTGLDRTIKHKMYGLDNILYTFSRYYTSKTLFFIYYGVVFWSHLCSQQGCKVSNSTVASGRDRRYTLSFFTPFFPKKKKVRVAHVIRHFPILFPGILQTYHPVLYKLPV